MKRIAAFLTAAVLTVAATLPMMTGSTRMEYAVTGSTLNSLGSYLLGDGSLEYGKGDINRDGSIDCFDLVLGRKYVTEYSDKVPEGMWVGTGDNGVRLFWFSGGAGYIFGASAAQVTDFTASVTDSRFTLTTGGTSAMADIVWNSADSFSLHWDDYGLEAFSPAGAQLMPSAELTGEYITSGDTGQRSWKFSGYTGSCDGRGFFWLPEEGGIKLCWCGSTEYGDIEHIALARTDRHHFTLTYEDGRRESFTRREITTVDGITYVNGILIANKTYALPSTYNPGGLTSETLAAFNEMKAAAYAEKGLSLTVCSGFRSYSYQATIYNNYVARDGKAKADTYSARPGHSEHQTGLAADINYAGDWFNTTPEAAWLAANCWKYGFIIRYPQGKQDITGYKYESWHVRYLGRELAKMVYDSGLTLEEYLGIDSSYKY